MVRNEIIFCVLSCAAVSPQDLISLFSITAPVVSYLGVDNNARTMQGTMTVQGLSFGETNNTPSGRIDSIVCATAAWSSATTVNCVNAHNFPSVITTEITVGLLTGTRYPKFTFDGWFSALLGFRCCQDY